MGSVHNGHKAAGFTVPDLHGGMHTLEDARNKLVILNFWSAECPWSERTDRELSDYQGEWGDQVLVWRIASNANEPPELLLRVADERNLTLVLHDRDQTVADEYGAMTTPHLFVLDQEGIVRYQGAFNDVTFRQREPIRHYLKDAIDALLSGNDPNPALTEPYGCTVVRFHED